MAQFLNPYEGVGNALIGIGQNYDLDRRRKREAEEDQKRRRSDFTWQQEQEAAEFDRRYKLEEPKRAMEEKIRLAKLAKAQADAVTAQMGMLSPKIVNLPGAGGSREMSPQFDEAGNVTGVSTRNIPYTPIPREPRAPSYVEGYDAEGNRTLFNPDTRETINTGMRGTAPPLLNQPLSQKDLREIDDKEFKALQAVDKLTGEQVIPGYNSTLHTQADVDAAKAKQRAEIQAHYARQRGGQQAQAATAASASTRPSMLGTISAAAKGFGGLMGGIADAVTPLSEQDVAEAKTATAGRKKEEEPDKPSYEAAFAQVEEAFPDWPKKKIDAYLRDKKGITPPKKK